MRISFIVVWILKHYRNVNWILNYNFDCIILHVICQLEKGVDGLFGSFARLDSRISSVGQTAAKIGDHLQVKFVLCLIANALFSSKVVLDKDDYSAIISLHFVICVCNYVDFSSQSADAQRETASQSIELIKVVTKHLVYATLFS